MDTAIMIIDSVLVILLVFFDIMESKENKHLRELFAQISKSVTLLIQQNRELWKLSHVVPKEDSGGQKK